MDSKKGETLVNQIKKQPMGDDQIKLYLPDAEIITYKELRNYNSIEELLPNHKSYKILLYESSPNNGHWVALMRYNFDEDTIEYFDGYGYGIDVPLKWIPKYARINLGQDEPYLGNLLKKTDLKVVQNTKKYQDYDPEIATCGRWDILRIMAMRDENMNLKQFQKWIEEMKKESGYTYDQIVSAFINNVDPENAKFLLKHLPEHR